MQLKINSERQRVITAGLRPKVFHNSKFSLKTRTKFKKKKFMPSTNQRVKNYIYWYQQKEKTLLMQNKILLIRKQKHYARILI